ncbi:Hypothetical predicted protein [Octopus vulgaris]|uniref:Uncharacterized protein n=1 Tax=Octopus vulgaris TaxID=6645 RepID=A0AA36F2U0_OCTVU|nr:Hypothetical predicted protein [Octopus vulgaris]
MVLDNDPKKNNVLDIRGDTSVDPQDVFTKRCTSFLKRLKRINISARKDISWNTENKYRLKIHYFQK